jgi:hypothetical protein
MENLNADWPAFPRLKFMHAKDELLEDFLSTSLRKRWESVERALQIMYDQQFERGLHLDKVQMQIRIALPKLMDPKSGERWFSALIQWGAPDVSWRDTQQVSGMSPEAMIAIYEAEETDDLTKIAHCVILDKDMHVKTRHLGAL